MSGVPYSGVKFSGTNYVLTSSDINNVIGFTPVQYFLRARPSTSREYAEQDIIVADWASDLTSPYDTYSSDFSTGVTGGWTCPETGLYKMDIRVTIQGTFPFLQDNLRLVYMQLENAPTPSSAYVSIAETHHWFEFYNGVLPTLGSSNKTTLNISDIFPFEKDSLTRTRVVFDIADTTTGKATVYGGAQSSWSITRVA